MSDEKDLAPAFNNVKATFAVDKILGVISAAHEKGAVTAQRLCELQLRSLDNAYAANEQLVSKALELTTKVADMAQTTVDLARINAEKDVRIAEINGGTELQNQLLGLLNTPMGIAVASKLGLPIEGGPPTPQKQAAGRVVKWLLAQDDLCAAIHNNLGDDWLEFLEFAKATF